MRRTTAKYSSFHLSQAQKNRLEAEGAKDIRVSACRQKAEVICTSVN